MIIKRISSDVLILKSSNYAVHFVLPLIPLVIALPAFLESIGAISNGGFYATIGLAILFVAVAYIVFVAPEFSRRIQIDKASGLIVCDETEIRSEKINHFDLSELTCVREGGRFLVFKYWPCLVFKDSEFPIGVGLLAPDEHKRRFGLKLADFAGVSFVSPEGERREPSRISDLRL